MNLVQALKSEAHRLGFVLVGITTPEPPLHISVYEQWIAAGLYGEMSYLATDRARRRRADPHAILPDCRSILVLGASYPTGALFPEKKEENDSSQIAPGRAVQRNLSGEIAHAEVAAGNLANSKDTQGLLAHGKNTHGLLAAYACLSDYHDLFPPRLQALVAFLETQVGRPIPNRWYTDTGPLLERDLAQRAGLGWIGKNTCLIAPGLGSYVLLSEILLGLDLEPDPPYLEDRCGTCTRCLEACPTGCILPDRTIDARRCISYLTIELKGAIPPDLRDRVGEWVFGCDICQQVCPWNRQASTSHPGLILNLPAELKLTPAEFNQRFQGTPVKRARRRGYLRNVTVALGNSHDPVAIPALSQILLHDPEPLVRAHAAWAIGQIQGEAAQQALQASAQVETEPSVRVEIVAALRHLRSGASKN
jgi:epoxyqueuosine reductase